jgi:hypothetical protein
MVMQESCNAEEKEAGSDRRDEDLYSLYRESTVMESKEGEGTQHPQVEAAASPLTRLGRTVTARRLLDESNENIGLNILPLVYPSKNIAHSEQSRSNNVEGDGRGCHSPILHH